MRIANGKGMVAKLMMVSLAAGAFALASPVKAQAPRFAIGVQLGNPDYRYYPNGYRYDQDDYRRTYDYGQREQREEYREREKQREEYREREERAEYARRQAYLRHEQWEHENQYYSPYGYR